MPFLQKRKGSEGEARQSRSDADLKYYAFIHRYYDIGMYENWRTAYFFYPPADPGFSQMHNFIGMDPFRAILADRANELLKHLIYDRESTPPEEKVHELYSLWSSKDENAMMEFFRQNVKNGDKESSIAAELAIANMFIRQDILDSLGWLAERGEGSAFVVVAGLSNMFMLPVEEDFLPVAEKLLERKNLFIEYGLAAMPLEKIASVAKRLAKSPDLNTKVELIMRYNASEAVMKILRESPNMAGMIGGFIRR